MHLVGVWLVWFGVERRREGGRDGRGRSRKSGFFFSLSFRLFSTQRKWNSLVHRRDPGPSGDAPDVLPLVGGDGDLFCW